jgi:uncharacterized protein YqgQ
MKSSEAKKRRQLLFMQLEIMRIYQSDMLSRFGIKGYEERLNLVLDELIIVLKVIRKKS